MSYRLIVISGAPVTPLQQCAAAVLSREAAFISGRAAAWLHGIGQTPYSQPPEITVPYSASGRNAVAKVRRSQHFSTITTNVVDGISVASPAETIFRMSEYVGRRRLTRMIDDLLLQERSSTVELGEIYLRHQGERMRGMASLRPILMERLDDAFVPTESELEALADRVLGAMDLPAVERQAPLPWAAGAGRLDRLIRDWRLIVEFDGRSWHARTEAFETDRERDHAALRNGYRTVRLTWRMLTERPEYCRRLIRDMGELRLASGS